MKNASSVYKYIEKGRNVVLVKYRTSKLRGLKGEQSRTVADTGTVSTSSQSRVLYSFASLRI